MAVRGKKDEDAERSEADAPERAEDRRTEEKEKRPEEKHTAERRPDEKRASARAAAERSPLELVREGLDDIVPGLAVLDRELQFEGARADLVAVDPAGRLYWVQIAGEDGDRAAVEALDALRVLRANLELFARHCGESQVDLERAPRLVVVSRGAEELLAQRLEALADAGVSVLGLRSVKSAAGERVYLVHLGEGARPAGGAGGVAAFLRALPARLEALGAALVERMGRLDEELALSADSSSVVWRLGGEVLCRVERIGDVLQASVAPEHEPLSLADAPDLERLVERALARLVRVLGLARGEREPAGGAPRPLGGRGSEPLLTPEEIQAFRE